MDIIGAKSANYYPIVRVNKFGNTILINCIPDWIMNLGVKKRMKKLLKSITV